MHSYHELRVPGRFNPLALVAPLADAQLFDRYVVYERDGQWWFAGGAFAEVELDRNRIRSRCLGVETVVPWTPRPLETVRQLLARIPATGWNAYGWMCFEFGYLGAERTGCVGEQPLLHLVVPHTEIRLDPYGVTVRSMDEAMLARVRSLITETARLRIEPATPVDVSACGGEAYRRAVARAVADIRQGHLQKVILSRRVPIGFPVDFVATYTRGRTGNTPARSFLLDLGGWKAAGFSPETVVEVTAAGQVSTQPLAGTRAYGCDPLLDADRRAELMSDPKEIFEHATSVKLAYDEMQEICEPGTVGVQEFMAIKERGSVQHLGSRVTGRLAAGRTSWDALEVLFPAVTASGIPKRPAYERIADIEEHPRDLYAGAVLMVSGDGTMDAALVLRAIFERDGKTWLRAGAGIVADSLPEREYEETCEKLRSIAPYVVQADHDRELLRIPGV